MSLIPDKPLLFFPQLAVALGLEGAVMIQALKELIERDTDRNNGEIIDGYLWAEIAGQSLAHQMPFWSESDIDRIIQRLHEQGILLADGLPYTTGRSLRLAINEQVAASTSPAITATSWPASDSTSMRYADHGYDNSPAKQASSEEHAAPPVHTFTTAPQMLSRQWQPDRDLLAQLAQYGIPHSFTLEQVGEFVTYWTERNEPRHSWSARFLKHVIRLWREQESRDYRLSQESVMSTDWRPSLEAMEILTVQAGINNNFVEDAIAEFILYWQERGIRCNTWNSRFIQHVKRQWARFTNTLKHDQEPQPISPDWQPDAEVFDILHMANIDRRFAEELIPEFILYWRDNGQALSTWNTKFLQYAKRQWASLNQSGANAADNGQPRNTVSHHGTQQGPRRSGSTRNRDIAAELNDRSWAS